MYRFTALVIALLLVPHMTFAAFIATDSFESYASGNTVNTLNGGTNWTTAWVESTAGDYKISNAQAQAGSLSMKYTQNAREPTAKRSFTGQTSGVLVAYLYDTNNAADTCEIQLYEGASVLNQVRMKSSGSITGNNGGVETTIQSYSSNTWYKFEIEFDMSTDQYRVSINDGTFTSWFNFFATGTNLDTMLFQRQSAGGSGDCYFDSIAPEAAAPTFTPLVPDIITL